MNTSTLSAKIISAFALMVFVISLPAWAKPDPKCDDNDQDDNDDDHNDGCEAPAQGPIRCREPYCVASTKLR